MKEKKRMLIIGAVLCVLIALIPIASYISKQAGEKIVKGFESLFQEGEINVLYIGRDDCSHCQNYVPVLADTVDEYGFVYYYINTNKLTSRQFEKILKKLDLDPQTFGTPYTVVLKDGKKAGEVMGEMDKDGLLSFLLENQVTGNEKVKVKNVTYETVNTLLNTTSKNFTLYLGKNNHTTSKSHLLMLERTAQKYNFSYYYLNVNDLTEEEYTKVCKLLGKDIKTLEVPYTITYKNDKKVNDYFGAFDDKAAFNYFKKTSDIASNVTYQRLTIDINYGEYKELFNSNKTNIFVYGSSSCGVCTMAKPILQEISNEYNVEINYIDLSLLTSAESEELFGGLSFFNTEEWGTPLTLIVKDKKVLTAQKGFSDKPSYVSFLKTNGLLQ